MKFKRLFKKSSQLYRRSFLRYLSDSRWRNRIDCCRPRFTAATAFKERRKCKLSNGSPFFNAHTGPFSVRVTVKRLQLKNGMATARLARTSVHSNEALVIATSLRLDMICSYLGWFYGRSHDLPQLEQSACQKQLEPLRPPGICC